MRKILILASLIFVMFLSGCFNVDREKTNKDDLRKKINEAQTLYNNTLVGNKIGNVSQATKDELNIALLKAKAVESNRDATEQEVKTEINEISNAINNFKSKILVKGNPQQLNAKITSAQAILTANPGASAEAKTKLQNAITSAQAIANDNNATNIDMENAIKNLDNAIKEFNSTISGMKYFYAADGSQEISVKEISNWGTGNVNINFTGETYNPCIKAETVDNGWGGGTPVAAVGFNDFAEGTITANAKIVFNIKTDMSEMIVKLESADLSNKEVTFKLADGEDIPGKTGWKKITLKASDFTGYDVTKAVKMGIHTGWGKQGKIFYLAEVKVVY